MPGPHRARSQRSTAFALFVVELPSLRAQSIQVVNSSHALARRGWRVRLWYRPTGGDPLEPYGLAPHPHLELRALPPGQTLASLVFRADIVRWARENRESGVFLARSKRYARFASRMAPHLPLVLEAHEVDSLQHARKGGERFAELESRALSGADALITNCEGVMHGLSWMHALPAVTRVVHNAWAAGPVSPSKGRGIAVAGSLLGSKDPRTIALAARDVGRIAMHGLPDPRMAELTELSHGNLVYAGPIAPAKLVDRLRAYATLVLPLGRGWFGEQFTSPLKAFAYQAARVPFVGADTPALRHAAPGAYEPFEPGDPASLARAITRLDDPAVRAARLAAARPRTWDDRALEVEEVLRAV